jgi:tetratricopeptide (TPR) repeat protein
VVHVAQALVSQHQATVTIDLDSKRAAWTTIEALLGLDALDAIVVSEAAAPFLDRRFELAPSAADDAIPFRRLTRREPTGFGLGGRPLSPFVGREAEVRLVTDRLAGAERGRGEVIGIVGEPGVGKSRFTYELTRLDATQGWRVLGSRGVSHGSTTPLLPISDLLRRYFAIEEADDPQVIRAKVTETILARHEDLTSFLTPLLSLLDLAVDDPSWSSFDPPQQRQRIQEAVTRLLLHESRVQPLVLIVEDLHWIDTATQALLDGLVESLPAARLLLLVNYRPEYQHRWGSKTYYSQLRLDALPPERATELLQALLGEDPSLSPLTRLLVERGNPFFIEESIRTLVETGALRGERGAYRVTQPIQAIEIPTTVQMILASRIERLSPDDKQLLQTASVIGKDVPFALLHAVTDLEEDDVHRSLARLQAAEFLYETRFGAEGEYTFKHALTHEVTYGTLPEDRRKDLHTRIVDAIERVQPERLAQHVEQLAHHAVRGELWEKAVAYLHQAGLKASARSANREAVSYFEQALGALGHRPENRETLEQAINLRFDAKMALLALADFERVVAYLREAEDLARTLGDRRLLARSLVHMCHGLVVAGHQQDAIVYGQRAQALGEPLGDVRLEVAGNLYLASAYFQIADYRQAEDLFLNVLRSLEGDLSRDRLGFTGFPAVLARGFLTGALTDCGKFEQGLVHVRDGIRLAEALNDPYSMASVSWFLADLHLARGEVRDAIGVLEGAVTLTRDHGLTSLLLRCTAGLGYAHALSGRPTEGLPLLEHAVRGLEKAGNPTVWSVCARLLGDAYVLAGRLDDALEIAQRTLSHARERGLRRYEVPALRLLGAVAARRDAPQHAEGHYHAALALADELGMRPVAAHCHAGLSTLYRRIGRGEPAREHLTVATALYREMGMRFWLEKVEAATNETA